MSRMLFVSLFAASFGVVGCQEAKFSGQKAAPVAQSPVAPIPNQPIQPLPLPPPINGPTDDYNGYIPQPNVPVQPPIVYVPPRPVPQEPIPQQPPPVYVPPQQPQLPQTPPTTPVAPTPVQPPQQPQLPPAIQQPPPINWNEPLPVTPTQPTTPIAPTPIAPTPVQPQLPPTLQNQPPINWAEPRPPLPPVPDFKPGKVDWNEPMPPNPQPVCTDPAGCGTTVVTPPPPPPQEDCRETSRCEPPAPVKGQCTAELNVERNRTKLDILFVVDTSASLRRGGTGTLEDGELIQIGRGMNNFVKNLDPQTDYRIGVMLGHGQDRVGKLFSAGDSDPAVIDYKTLKREGLSRAQIEAQLARMMEKKMRAVPNESGGAQGEAMMLNLYKSITVRENLARIKRQGLYRSDAALAVVFVSDEQDVCFDYSTASPEVLANRAMKQVRGAQGAIEKTEDPYEVAFFNNVCKTAANGRPLTPGVVYDALMSLKGNDRSKVMVNVIGYIKPISQTLGVENKPEDENEQAWGMIDLNTLASNGQLAEMANVVKLKTQFAAELNQIGQYTHFKMKYNHSYICRSDIHPNAINFTSMQAKVLTKDGQQLATFFGGCSDGRGCPEGITGPANGEIMTDTRGRKHTPYTRVDVSAETLKTVLESQSATDGRVEMEFWTKSDINPKTGKAWDKKDLRPKATTTVPAAPAPKASQKDAQGQHPIGGL